MEKIVAMAIFAEVAMNEMLNNNQVAISRDGKSLIWRDEEAKAAYFDTINAMKICAD